MSTPFISTLSVENAHRSDIYAVDTCVRYTVAASGDGIISLWDNKSPSETLTALNQTPVPSGIHHMAVDDAGYVVAVAFDGSVLVFDLKSQAPLQLNATSSIKGAWGCALSGTHTAISTLQGSIYVVDVANDSLVVELSEPTSSASGKAQPCLCVDISSDAKFVVGGYESGKTRVFSVDSGRIAYTLPTHISRPRCVKFNRQVSMLAVTGNESIALYTLTGGSYLGSLLGHESFVYSIDFESSGERLLSVAGDGKLKVWSLDLREAVFTITDTNSPLFAGSWVPERTNVIAGAPAGFVTAGVDRTIRWYREASGSANDL